MCDYSLQAFKSRPAQVGERLVTHDFGVGTRGFCGTGEIDTAVCVLPGTELAFSHEVQFFGGYYGIEDVAPIPHKTAIFRQTNTHLPHQHHDTLEFPDGRIMLLTALRSGQECFVLQLPAAPRTPQEVLEQKRVEVVG